MDIKEEWEWYDYFTLVVLIVMIIAYLSWWSDLSVPWWLPPRLCGGDSCVTSTWWLGWSVLLGHFIASITS